MSCSFVTVSGGVGLGLAYGRDLFPRCMRAGLGLLFPRCCRDGPSEAKGSLGRSTVGIYNTYKVYHVIF